MSLILDGTNGITLPIASTPPEGDNSTKIATTAFVRDIIPGGVITMWSGSIASIPVGWALCDGANGTPDLRNRFIIGASADNTGVSNTTITGSNTKTGGSKDAIAVSHSHTADHSHTGSTNSTGAHTHTQSVGTGTGTNAGNAYNNGSGLYPQQTSSSGAHSHTVTVDSASVTTSSAGSSGTDANLPPYLALAYIMKL